MTTCRTAPPSSALLARTLPAEDADAPLFAEPWEARAFALVVTLAREGHFAWGEWVEVFSKEVAAADAIEAAGGTPPGYYAQWLAAAEKLLADKGLAAPPQVEARRLAIAVAGPSKARYWRAAEA